MHQDIDFVRNQREACYNCSCFFLFSLAFFLLILFLYLDFGLFEYLSFSHVDQENFCSACDRRTVTFIEQWDHNTTTTYTQAAYSRDKLIALMSHAQRSEPQMYQLKSGGKHTEDAEVEDRRGQGRRR